MPQPQARIVDSFRELETLARPWHDLWERSDQTSPVLRAELLGNWLESFAPGRAFRAVVIEQDGRLVAALPLVEQRLARLVRTGTLPCNAWSLAGDLLFDPRADADQVLRCLARSVNELPWPLLKLSFARTDSPAWRQLLPALAAAGLTVECRPSYDVTYIETPPDWEAYRRSWSKNHRHRVGGRLRRLKEQGEVRLRRAVPSTAEEAFELLAQTLRIEDSGWKGKAGTSMLRTPVVVEYLRRLASLLLPTRELEFAFLDLDGRPLAFEILLHSKGVLHSYKVGYDETFEQYDPGHLLMHELLHESCLTQRNRGYDCMGPNHVGLRRWRGSTYQVGQFVIAPDRWIGRALMFTYRHCRRPQRPADILRQAPESDTAEAPALPAAAVPAPGTPADPTCAAESAPFRQINS